MIATRPDWCISRQRVWGVPIIVFYCENLPGADDRPQDPAIAWSSCSRQHTADVWYDTLGRRTDWPGRHLPDVAADANSAKRPTFSTSGSIPAPAIWPCSRRRTVCRGRRTCIWKAAINIAAGSTARCWSASALQGRSAVSRVRHQRLDARRAGPRDVEVARHRRRAGRSHQRNTAPTCCACGSLRSISPKTCASPTPSSSGSPKPIVKLRNTVFRYVLGNLVRLRSGNRRRGRRRKLPEIDQWILLKDRRIGREMPRLVRRIRVPQGLSRGLRFRHHRPERRLLRHRARIASTPPRPSRTRAAARRPPSIASPTRWFACSRRCCRSPPKKSGANCRKPAGTPDSVHLALLPGAERTDAGHHRRRSASASRNWDQPHAVRDDVLKALEVARQEKTIGKSLEARVT